MVGETTRLIQKTEGEASSTTKCNTTPILPQRLLRSGLCLSSRKLAFSLRLPQLLFARILSVLAAKYAITMVAMNLLTQNHLTLICTSVMFANECTTGN
eukprot:30309-Pelagomonas_calceolata.AAC.1